MVIFHSYASLPEGNPLSLGDFGGFTVYESQEKFQGDDEPAENAWHEILAM